MKEIKLTKNKITLVDDEDYEWLNKYRWQAMKDKTTWYAISKLGRKVILMHRLILGLGSYKEDPVHGDHINHNGLVS